MIKNRDKLENIKREYITGTIDENGISSCKSLDFLIKKYNMAPATVYRHSSVDNWKVQRKDYQLKIHKLYLSNTMAKNQMNETIILILNKTKKILNQKNFDAKELYHLTETIKMCKENLEELNNY